MTPSMGDPQLKGSGPQGTTGEDQSDPHLHLGLERERVLSGSVGLSEDARGQVILHMYGCGRPGPGSTTVQHARGSPYPATL